METIQVAVAILTVMTCLLGLVAVSTDYWLVNEDDTQSAGLFNSCVGVSCIKSIETIPVATIALFITGLFENFVGSITIFIGWNKRKKRYENIGIVLLLIGTIQFCTGASIFTYIHPLPSSGLHNWGLSFALAWGASGLSVIASFLAIFVYFKNHHRFTTAIPSRKRKSFKMNTVLKKEAYV